MMSRAARVPTTVLAAVAINILLFSIIQYMVGSPRLRLSDISDIDVSNFIRMQEQTHEVRSRRDPLAPEKPPVRQQRTMQQLAQSATPAITDMQIDVPEMEIEIGMNIGDIHIARELTPLVKIPPEYPQRALAKEIEPLEAAAARSGELVLELGGHRTASFAACDLVVVSPGIPLALPFFDISRKAGIEILAEVD